MKAHTLLLTLLAIALPTTSSAAPSKPRQRNVAIVVYERAEILDFAGPAEVLAAAGKFAGGDGTSTLNVYLVARTAEPIKAQGFIRITPDYTIDNAPVPDLVVIPGGASAPLSDDPAMLKWLTTSATKSEVTLTVCTGVFPLAKAGLLDGKDITTWYGAIDNLRTSAPNARVHHGRRFVDSGRYITTAGVSAGIDGALHLVARLFGRRVADQTARYMEYHWTPEPYLASAYAYWNPSTDERGRARQAAELALEEKRWPEAAAQLEKLAAGDKGTPVYKTTMYNLACAYALAGNKARALAALRPALAAGITHDQALADPDLGSIKHEIAKLRAKAP